MVRGCMRCISLLPPPTLPYLPPPSGGSVPVDSGRNSGYFGNLFRLDTHTRTCAEMSALRELSVSRTDVTNDGVLRVIGM